MIFLSGPSNNGVGYNPLRSKIFLSPVLPRHLDEKRYEYLKDTAVK
jgi:hypothetical protein